MGSITQHLLQHSYLLLFSASFVERVGVPLLVSPLVIAAGASAGAGKLSFWMIVLAVVVPCVLVDGGWYWLGKKKGNTVLRWICKLSLERDSCTRRIQDLTARYAGLSLIYSKFLPGLGRMAPPMAGLAQMKLLTFYFWETIGTTVWTLVFVLFGYVATAGIHWPSVTQLLLEYLPALLLLAIFANITWKLIRREMFVRSLRAVRISPEELKARLDGDDLVVIDLRHFLDVLHDARSIPGSIHIYPEDLANRYNEIPAEKDIILYCT